MHAFHKILDHKPGWYRGDLHAHTTYSDGVLRPSELIELAVAEKLDFLAITDHNTIGSFAELEDAANLAFIPGVEVTLDLGHFNVFGTAAWQAWMDGICDLPSRSGLPELNRPVEELMGEISAAGFLNSINHPLLVPWAWEDLGTRLAHLHAVEIWNDPSWPGNQTANPQALSLWTEWLNAGYRITAIGGSDFHRPVPLPGMDKVPERLGIPRTYVFAENLSGKAVLDAVLRRRAYVTIGPEVTLRADGPGVSCEIGQAVEHVSGEVVLTGTVTKADEQVTGRIVKNGRILAERRGESPNLRVESVDQIHPDRSAWYRLEVLDLQGATLAVTNPIFLGRQPEIVKRVYGDFPL